MQARPLCRAAVGGLRAAARAASGGDGGRQRQRPRGCSWPGPRRRRAAARARIPAGGPCPGGAHVTRPACARMMLWGVCGTGGAEFFFCVSAQMWHDACGWCAAEKKRWVGEREAHANPATPFPAHVPPLSPAAPPCSAPSPPHAHRPSFSHLSIQLRCQPLTPARSLPLPVRPMRLATKPNDAHKLASVWRVWREWQGA